MKDKNRLALISLAMNLKRVALGYYKNSNKVADRFLEEAIKRKNEINFSNLKPYLKNLLNNLDNIKKKENKQEVAEDALMYSTLFQNAPLTRR